VQLVRSCEFAFQRGKREREREREREKWHLAFSTTMMTYLGNDAGALNAVAESLTLFRISSSAHAVPFIYAIPLPHKTLSLSLTATEALAQSMFIPLGSFYTIQSLLISRERN